MEYHELFPNALREAAEGKSGCIYTVEADENGVIPFPYNPNARLGTVPLKVQDTLYIPDCYQWLMEQVKKGLFAVSRFEEKTECSLNWWYDAVLRYITEKLHDRNAGMLLCPVRAGEVSVDMGEVCPTWQLRELFSK